MEPTVDLAAELADIAGRLEALAATAEVVGDVGAVRAVVLGWARIEAVAAGNKTLAVAAAARRGGYRSAGMTSAAQSLAADTGCTVGEAHTMVRVAHRSIAHPAVAAALAAGEVTVSQADRVLAGAEAARGRLDIVGELLDLARGRDAFALRTRVGELCRNQHPADQHARIRAGRSVRAWIDHHGAGNLLLRTTADELGRALATFQAETDRRLLTTLARGVRRDHIAADTLVDLIAGYRATRPDDADHPDLDQGHADRSASWLDDDGSIITVRPDGTFIRTTLDGAAVHQRHPEPGPVDLDDPESTPVGSAWARTRPHVWFPHAMPDTARDDPPPDSHAWGRCPTCGHDHDPRTVWRRAARVKVIFRCDLTALARGYPLDGETVDLAGYGPVPLDAIRAVLPDAAVSIICTDGVDAVNVTNLNRRHTAAQTTILEWVAGVRCAVPRCQNRAQLEWDHIHDYATTHTTTTTDTQPLCGTHHQTKPHQHDFRTPALPPPEPDWTWADIGDPDEPTTLPLDPTGAIDLDALERRQRR